MDLRRMLAGAISGILASTLVAVAPAATAATTSPSAARLPTVSPTPHSMRALGGPLPLRGRPGSPRARLHLSSGADDAAVRALTDVLRQAGIQNLERVGTGTEVRGGAALDLWVGGPSEGNDGSAAILERLGVHGPAGLPHGGYVLATGRDKGQVVAILSGVDKAGTFYAVQTFRQILTHHGKRAFVASLAIRDWPSFPLRGGMESFYGDPWSQSDALSQVDFLAAHKMNAMLYTPSGDPRTAGSLWRKPYPRDEFTKFARLIDHARKRHIDFIYRVNPEAQLDPKAGICHADEDDLRALVGRFEQLWSAGERIFSIGWDDAGGQFVCETDTAKFGDEASPLAAAQAYTVNYVYEHFVQTHDGARLTTVPAQYWGTETTPYRTMFAHRIPAAVSIFWTGPQVVSPTITRADLDRASDAFGGRHLLIFDNYPVNDYAPNRQHLGPLVGRDPDLAGAAAGFFANEMQQEEASQIALFTVADYAWNAAGYDPQRSWARSIREFGDTAAKALRTYAANSVASPLHTGEASPVQPLIAAFVNAYKSGRPLHKTAHALSAALRKAQQAPSVIRSTLPNPRFVKQSDPWLDKLAAQAGAGLAAVEALRAQVQGDRDRVQDARSRMDSLVRRARAIPQVVASAVYDRLTNFAKKETDRFLSPHPTTVTAMAPRQLVAAGTANTVKFTFVGLAPRRLDATVAVSVPDGWQAMAKPSTISVRSDNRTVRAIIRVVVTPPDSAIDSTAKVALSVSTREEETATVATPVTVAAQPTADFSSLVLAEYPAGYWRLGDTGSVARDFSGNGNDGHDVGAVKHGAPGALPGDTDTAVRLAGGYVDVPNSPTVALTGSFTIAAWVKTTVSGVQQGIIEKYDTPYPNGYVLRIGTDGRLRAYANDDNSTVGVTGASVVTPNTWHFVVATADGTSLKVYLDGFLDGTTATTVLPTPGHLDLRLGARGDDTSYRLQGELDEVAIYPVALTLEQIRGQYLAGTVGAG